MPMTPDDETTTDEAASAQATPARSPETPDDDGTGEALPKGDAPLTADQRDDDTSDEDAADPDAGPTFADLGLPGELLQAVTRMGYVTPTPIQAEAIPPLLAGRDVVGVAQTGTGKTAAFGLPLLATVDSGERDVQALVLAPTRELAVQSAQALEDFASRSRNVEVVAVYGGSAYGPQLKALRQGAQVVVGTPGRIIDLIEKGALDLSSVRVLVLDEADEMLRMGFAEDVETIAASVPDERLTALFSATMPPAIAKVASTHLNDPVRIAVSTQSSTVDTITQTYAVVPFKHKIGALARVLSTRDTSEGSAAIVFVRTRADVEEIALELSSRGFRASGISGDVAQTERERLVERLRSGTLDVLVATDVAARGLDVERIGLVVNFDVPREPEAYVHRIGRTGRAGREGRAITFFTPREHQRLRRIERLTGTPMEEVEIPSPAAVSKFRARRTLDTVAGRIERGRLDLYHTLLDEVHDATDLDISDIAAALLAAAVGDEGPAPHADKDRRGSGRVRREERVDETGEFLGASFEGGRDRDRDRDLKGGRDGARRRGGARPVGTPGRRYRVEVGRKDGVMPGAIVGAITGEGGLRGSDLGRIEIFPTFSLVEIGADMDGETMNRISKAQVQGRALRIREDSGPSAEGAPARGRDRGERGDRHEGARRFDRRDREDRGLDRGERGDHGKRPFRRDDREDRGGRFDRGDRGGRFERDDRSQRFGGSRGGQGPRHRH